MSQVKVSPSILSADFARLGEEVAAVEAAGADWVHVDVMDGHFVPNLTMGVPVVASLKEVTDLPLDVHLMITNPDDLVEPFAEAGADVLTFHTETTDDPAGLIDRVHDLGVKAGMTARPSTGIDGVVPHAADLDLWLVMTVEPGFSGQSFMHDQVPAIERARQVLDDVNPTCHLEVDGGVNADTADVVRKAGADVLVAGSGIYGQDDYAAAIRALKGA